MEEDRGYEEDDSCSDQQQPKQPVVAHAPDDRRVAETAQHRCDRRRHEDQRERGRADVLEEQRFAARESQGLGE